MTKIFNISAGGIKPYQIADYSYLCGRNFTEDRMYLFDLQKPTNMSYMFFENDVWNDVDLSLYINSEKSNMPTGAISMDHLCHLHNTLTSFKFPQDLICSNASSMFQNCTALTHIDWDGLKITPIASMLNMLNGCKALVSTDMSGVSITGIGMSDLSSSFCNCTALTDIKLPAGLKPLKLYNMFANDTKLKTIDFNDIDTSQCIDFRAMFQNCSSLEAFDGSKIVDRLAATPYDLQSFFNGCTSLRKVWLSKSMYIRPDTAARSPFYSCGGPEQYNPGMTIYTDAVLGSPVTQTDAGGMWNERWNCYSAAGGKIPDTNIVWNATYEAFLNA